MRRARLLMLPLVLAPLVLTGCIALPPTISAPQPSDPAATPPASTEPEAPTQPSTPPSTDPTPSTEPSESDEPTEPTGDGDFTISIDGSEITSDWVAGVSCQFTSSVGTIGNDTDSDTDHFTTLLSEEDGVITPSLSVLADGDTTLIGTGENASVTMEGDQISGSIEMTSDFMDTVTVEFSGTCTGL